MYLSKAQYEAIQPIVEELDQKYGYIDIDILLAEIDRRVASGEIEPVFTATTEEVYDRYRREIISQFMLRWEVETKEYWLGVASQQESIGAYYRLEMAHTESSVAKKARQEYITALTMLRTYGPYASSWGKELQDISGDIDEVEEHIKANWRSLVEKNPP